MDNPQLINSLNIEDKPIIYKICKVSMKSLTNTHLNKHNLNFEEYKQLFPNSIILGAEIIEKRKIKCIGKKRSEKAKFKMRLAMIRRKERFGFINSLETRRKISNTLRGIKISDERLQKLIDYYRTHDNPFKGKKHLEETKKKISEVGKGRIPWNKGKNCPLETREKN